MAGKSETQDDYQQEQGQDETVRMDVKSRVQHFINTPCDTEAKLDSAIRRLFYDPPDQRTRATQTDPVKRKRKTKREIQTEDTSEEQEKKKAKKNSPKTKTTKVEEPQKMALKPILIRARNTSPTLIRVRSMQDLGTITTTNRGTISQPTWHEPTSGQQKMEEKSETKNNDAPTRVIETVPEQVRQLLTSAPTPLHQLCKKTQDNDKLRSESDMTVETKKIPVQQPRTLREERKARLKGKRHSKKRTKPWHNEVVVGPPVSLKLDDYAVEEPQPEYQCSIIDNGIGIKLQVTPRKETGIIIDNAEMDITTRRTKRKPKEKWILKQWPPPQTKTSTMDLANDEEILVEWSSTTHCDPRFKN